MPANDLDSVAQPTLNEAQVQRLVGCTDARPMRFPAGAKLFSAGDRDFGFFLVRSGEVDLLDPATDPPKLVLVHGPGQFTGDVAQLGGAASLVDAVARVDTEVWAVASASLRQLLNRCPDIGDVIVQAFIARRQLAHHSGAFVGVRVIGSRFSADTFRVRDFLAKNRVPFTWVDLEEEPRVAELLAHLGATPEDTPVVEWRGRVLRRPSNRELADTIGIRRPVDHRMVDLAIVGSGPAGLAAAVYGASEGLDTVMFERTAPGGQAGNSMRIENYLGFPTGMTGRDLADRGVVQAERFGAALSVPTPVVGMRFEGAYAVVDLDGGESVVAKTVVIASGAEYRRLTDAGCERFEGRGVYYAATLNEAPLCVGRDVVVVGGGNGAGQAAVFLASRARKVYVLIRGDSIRKDMSAYLAARCEQTPNIEIRTHTVVRRMLGDVQLEAVEIQGTVTGAVETVRTPALFSFIGADPCTTWLPPEIELDDKGFVRTGPALAESPRWTRQRSPFLLETSRPGVLAAGDVRSGSVKRVASAVGEGAMAVQIVHQCLKEL